MSIHYVETILQIFPLHTWNARPCFLMLSWYEVYLGQSYCLFPPPPLTHTFLVLKSIVCVCVWVCICVCVEGGSWSVFVPVIWAASKSLGCGAHRCKRRKKGGGGVCGGVAHRKSTELNINPGCQERMALAVEDKEGHCFFWVQGFWGGGTFFPKLAVFTLKQFFATNYDRVINKNTKGVEV